MHGSQMKQFLDEENNNVRNVMLRNETKGTDN